MRLVLRKTGEAVVTKYQLRCSAGLLLLLQEGARQTGVVALLANCVFAVIVEAVSTDALILRQEQVLNTVCSVRTISASVWRSLASFALIGALSTNQHVVLEVACHTRTTGALLCLVQSESAGPSARTLCAVSAWSRAEGAACVALQALLLYVVVVTVALLVVVEAGKTRTALVDEWSVGPVRLLLGRAGSTRRGVCSAFALTTGVVAFRADSAISREIVEVALQTGAGMHKVVLGLICPKLLCDVRWTLSAIIRPADTGLTRRTALYTAGVAPVVEEAYTAYAGVNGWSLIRLLLLFSIIRRRKIARTALVPGSACTRLTGVVTLLAKDFANVYVTVRARTLVLRRGRLLLLLPTTTSTSRKILSVHLCRCCLVQAKCARRWSRPTACWACVVACTAYALAVFKERRFAGTGLIVRVGGRRPTLSCVGTGFALFWAGPETA